MNRVLICNIVPNNLVHLINAPQAANNFCFNLIESQCIDYGISIVPSSYFDDRIKNEKNMFFYHGKPSNKYWGFLQIIYFNIICAIKVRNVKHIWFYNIVNANFLCYLILKYIYRRKLCIILLDHTPSKSFYKLQAYTPYLFKKASGLISLSSRTTISNYNIKYIAGIIPSYKISDKIYSTNKKKKFLFSGNLGAHGGFHMALEAFKHLPSVELYVTGLGNFNLETANELPNIRFLGYLSYTDYLKIYDEVDICLSFRDPALPENENNFPSKMLEYFSYNKAVISTINYPELVNFNYFICEYNQQSIVDLIIKVANLSDAELLPYLDNSKHMINAFSEKRWIKDIVEIEQRL